MIHYLVYVDTHGDIRFIKPAKGDNNPAEGVGADGLNCRHLMEPLADAGNFMSTKCWSYSAGAWISRAAKPNRHAAWVDGTWTWDSDLLLADIRTERNKIIFQSDWAVVADTPLTDAQQTEARTYRTSLRDLPSTLDMSTIRSLNDITWPTPPDFIA